MRMLLLLPVVVCSVGLFSCSDEDLIAVKQYFLPFPSSSPAIDRSQLVSGGSYAVGYTTGNIRSNRVTLTWQRSGDANFLAYRVVRGSLLVRTIVDPQVTSATDSGLAQNTFYKYTVATIVQEGTHAYDSVTIKTPRFLAPTISGQVQADTSVRLVWNRSAESATSYRLERSPGTGVYITLANPTDTFYVDRSVQYGGTYFYRVAAVNQFESTPVSTPVSFTVTFFFTDGFESGSLVSWVTAGNLPWVATNTGAYTGTWCARSGAITHSQSSYIQRTFSFSTARTISFSYRVSSEPGGDVLRFTINGVAAAPDRSGETGWQSYSTTFTGTGSVTLRWEYIKNASVSSGTDAAWIDNVVIQ